MYQIPMIPKVKKYAFLILYVILLIGLSSIPPKALKSSSPWISDKVVHFVLYVGAGISFSTAFATPLQTWGATLLMGALDENYQRFTRRSCDLYDWIADALGGAVGTTLAFLYAKRRKQS